MYDKIGQERDLKNFLSIAPIWESATARALLFGVENDMGI